MLRHTCSICVCGEGREAAGRLSHSVAQIGLKFMAIVLQGLQAQATTHGLVHLMTLILGSDLHSSTPGLKHAQDPISASPGLVNALPSILLAFQQHLGPFLPLAHLLMPGFLPCHSLPHPHFEFSFQGAALTQTLATRTSCNPPLR